MATFMLCIFCHNWKKKRNNKKLRHYKKINTVDESITRIPPLSWYLTLIEFNSCYRNKDSMLKELWKIIQHLYATSVFGHLYCKKYDITFKKICTVFFRYCSLYLETTLLYSEVCPWAYERTHTNTQYHIACFSNSHLSLNTLLRTFQIFSGKAEPFMVSCPRSRQSQPALGLC